MLVVLFCSVVRALRTALAVQWGGVGSFRPYPRPL